MKARDPRLRGLYLVTDARLAPDEHLRSAVEAALNGGARIVQYRDKSDDAARRRAQALALRELCSRHGALFLVNDDVALAQACGADGVHLGREDMPIETARVRLGEAAIIGVSCYDQLSLALDAQARGADYVAFGAFFPSGVKPEAVRAPVALLSRAREALQLPICAIGGITAENGAPLIRHGADMLAVISAVLARENVACAAHEIHQLFVNPLQDASR